MTCSGTLAALEAAEEAPRCPRCDRLMPELTCDCLYGIKPSPLTSKEVLVVTDDFDAQRLLRSLRARYAPAHGWFITPGRARIFEALMEAEAVVARRARCYRFPDGTIRDTYSATRHIRQTTKKRAMT